MQPQGMVVLALLIVIGWVGLTSAMKSRLRHALVRVAYRRPRSD
jgi:hypothetical protein